MYIAQSGCEVDQMLCECDLSFVNTESEIEQCINMREAARWRDKYKYIILSKLLTCYLTRNYCSGLWHISGAYWYWIGVGSMPGLCKPQICSDGNIFDFQSLLKTWKGILTLKNIAYRIKGYSWSQKRIITVKLQNLTPWCSDTAQVKNANYSCKNYMISTINQCTLRARILSQLF